MRREVPRPTVSGGAGLASSGWALAYPLLWEHLTAVVWEDGSPRETSTLLLFIERMEWKGMLKDRSEGRIGFKSGDTPEDVLHALEASLQSGGMDWRSDRFATGKRPRGKGS